MQRFETHGRREFFGLLGGTTRSQAATMTLEPGQSTGGPDNRHGHQDQWLYVASGTGRAIVEGQRTELGPHDLLLIEADEAHEIIAESDEPLVTVNIYAPPAY